MAAVETVLNVLKKSLGVLDNEKSLDEYYKGLIDTATYSLLAEDISVTILATDFGKRAVVMYCKLLDSGVDIAENATMQLLRNQLSSQTKSERYANV